MARGHPVAKRCRVEMQKPAPTPQLVASAMMKFDMPVQQIVAILRETEPEGEPELTVRDCTGEYTKFSKLDTKYGKVCHELPIELEDGSSHNLYVNNPFALLFAAASLSKPFSRFLQKHLKQTNAINFYTDETTPGNNMRPDSGRTYEALLWTFTDLPPWWRTRRHGWFKFCYVLASVRDKVRGGMPAIVKAMLHSFYPPPGVSEFCFIGSGMRIPTDTGTFHISAKKSGFTVDEKASKVDFSVKGASGVKCCLYCKNCCKSAADASGSDYLIHFTEPRRARFDLHTAASFNEIKCLLDHLKDNPAELKEAEILTGVKFDPHGILWDEHLAGLLNMPHGWYVDAMHCLYSSGGIAQYEVNGYCLAVMSEGISLEVLDTFAANCKGVKLNKTFFATRVVSGQNAHIRAFASEVIEAVYVLNLFNDLVVRKTGKLNQHVECLSLLHDITMILTNPPNAVLNKDILEQKLEAHQTNFIVLYHSVPKVHLTRHIVDSIEKHGFFSTCFSAERDHSRSKSIARHAFRNCTKTLLDRMNYHFFTDIICDETVFQETHLSSPAKCEALEQLLPPGTRVRVSNNIMCQAGDVCRGSFVYVFDATSNHNVLVTVTAFLEVTPDGFEPQFFMLCSPLSKLRAREWKTMSRTVCVPTQHILRRETVYSDPDSPNVVHTCV